MRGQPFPGQQQVIFVTQQESIFKERPHMFSSNQSPTFLPNATIINLDPGQRVVQYNPQNPYSPSTSQQSTANRTFPLGLYVCSALASSITFGLDFRLTDFKALLEH